MYGPPNPLAQQLLFQFPPILYITIFGSHSIDHAPLFQCLDTKFGALASTTSYRNTIFAAFESHPLLGYIFLWEKNALIQYPTSVSSMISIINSSSLSSRALMV